KFDPESVLVAQARDIVQELGYRKTFPNQAEKAVVTSNSEKEVFEAYILSGLRQLDLLEGFQKLSNEIRTDDFKILRQEIYHYYPDLAGTISDLRAEEMSLFIEKRDAYYQALEEGKSVPHYQDLTFPETTLGQSLTILHYFECRLETPDQMRVPSAYSDNRFECRLTRFTDEQLLVLLDKTSSLLNKDEREQFHPALAAVYDKLSNEIALLAPDMEYEKDLFLHLAEPEVQDSDYIEYEQEIEDRSIDESGYESRQEYLELETENDREKEDEEL
ncbi:MAG: hypothetical protein K2Z81_21570, partial [Cyanobacteria bacterium]|nr:hypothetical protein [Cyanobacteriota bacterium]